MIARWKKCLRKVTLRSAVEIATTISGMTFARMALSGAHEDLNPLALRTPRGRRHAQDVYV